MAPNQSGQSTQSSCAVSNCSSTLGQLLYNWNPFAATMCQSKARLDGKTVIITGANRGIGLHTAKDLARRGAKVILACRNIDQTRKIAQDIAQETGNPQVEALPLDLNSLQSVKEFAQSILDTQEELHILIANAGIAGESQRKVTKDGFEQVFQVNHLGHFLLIKLLLPLIKKSAPSRIILVSSAAHQALWSFDLENVNSDKFYHSWIAYGKSKLENILTTKYLASELKDSGVTVNAMHPGPVDTGLASDLAGPWFDMFVSPLKRILYRTPEQGAQTIIYLAVEPSLDTVSGKYFADCKPSKPTKLARDFKLAKDLWDKSEKLIEPYL